MIWKKLKITVEQKPFQRDQLEKGKKQILDEPQSGFPLKMDNYKSTDLSLQIRIVNSTSLMTSTKGQVILVTQKQCQLLLGEPQHTKKLMHASFDMGFTTVLRTPYKNVIVVKYKVVVKNEMHSVTVSSHVMKQIGLDLRSLPKMDDYHHFIVFIDYFIKWPDAKPIRDETA